MKTAAIICEYNPFHNGHEYHIEETKRQSGAESVIALMSGNFVQRGDAAVFDKRLRAEAAVRGGADLVLELPSVYAVQSAEFFAKGAVFILDSLGIVDFLSFGAECPQSDRIMQLSRLLSDEPPELKARINAFCGKGLSYPRARTDAVGELYGSEYSELLSPPNNILAVEYCKALLRLNSTIQPLPVFRSGAAHDSDSPCGGIASATHLRELLYSGKSDLAFEYMPSFCREIFNGAEIHSTAAMDRAIICGILKMPPQRLREISDVSEGLENRIKQMALSCTTVSALADAVKTKRYTHSRIRRIILSAYLGITAADRAALPPYIKVLAHSETGCALIRRIKKAASLPLVRNRSQLNKLKNPAASEFWEREDMFDTIYTFFRS